MQTGFVSCPLQVLHNLTQIIAYSDDSLTVSNAFLTCPAADTDPIGPGHAATVYDGQQLAAVLSYMRDNPNGYNDQQVSIYLRGRVSLAGLKPMLLPGVEITMIGREGVGA